MGRAKRTGCENENATPLAARGASSECESAQMERGVSWDHEDAPGAICVKHNSTVATLRFDRDCGDCCTEVPEMATSVGCTDVIRAACQQKHTLLGCVRLPGDEEGGT